MNTFKDYIKYRLRSSLLRTAAFAAIALVMTYYYISPSLSIWNVADNIGADFYYKVPGGIYAGYLDLTFIGAVLIIAAAVIAVLEMADFKNKRNLDTFYSLPLSRFQLALAHYISGAVQVFAVFTAPVLCALVASLPYIAYLKLWILPVYYIFSLIFGLGFYSFVCFFFSEGNTLVDGIVFSGMWFFALMAIFGTLNDSEAFSHYLSNITIRDYKIVFADYSTWGMASAPLENLATVFTDMIGVGKNLKPSAERIMDTFYMFYVWAGIYAACAYGYFRSFVRRGAEKAGEISESGFGYKFLIPFYALCLFLSGVGILYSVFIFALMFIGYVIYRRGVKLKKSDIFAMIAALAVLLLTLYRPIENLLPFAAALALTIGCLVRVISALCKKLGVKETVKRAVLFALSAALLAVLTVSGLDMILRYISSALWLILGIR